MSLSWTQAATGALTAAVVAGLLVMPARLLGPDSRERAAIPDPVATMPAPVVAAPVVAVATEPARTTKRRPPGAAPVVAAAAPAPAPAVVRAAPPLAVTR